jgi:glycosyltransferase involved in cell wall biosynthesis
MSPGPLVTVVIPCFNHGRYLDEAVGSVLAQTLDAVEIVVVDDGSTDPFTRDLLAGYSRPKTRVIRQRNQGLAASRNHGIRESSAPYICCLDADDRIRPTYLARTVEVLERDPAVGIAATYAHGFGDRELDWDCGPCRIPEMLFGNTVVCSSLFRREGWERAGGYREHLTIAEDWDFWLSLFQLGYTGEVVPEVLFEWRIRDDSMWHSDSQDPVLMGRINREIWEAHAPLYIAHLGEVAELVGADHAATRAAIARGEELERALAERERSQPGVTDPPGLPVTVRPLRRLLNYARRRRPSAPETR